MKMHNTPLPALDWTGIATDLHAKGYATVTGFLPHEICRQLIDGFDHPTGYRKTVEMERYRFGRGIYKYWDYPLPAIVQQLREMLYPGLAPIANEWMNQLGLDKRFPDDFDQLQRQCHAGNQCKPTPLILRYEAGGYNTLHQDLYGELYFPLQAACFLNAPGRDYTGGEFVLTEQTPRAQSKAIVLTPGQGDMLIFATQFRPVKGARGLYRATMKHGVSEVHSGQRYAMGIIFHDATT